MKRINLIWVIALILVIPNTLAYINCTTSACPSGYTDNGVKCEGATCIRNCTIEECKQDWTQVASDTNVGWLDNSRLEENDISSSYTPTNTGRCYNFTYDATHMADHEVSITVDAVSPDCDSEAIGGFWDDTQRSSPWFSNMNDYIENVGDPEFDYLVKTMRAHTEGDADSSYRSKIRVKGGILCAPNTNACSKVGGIGICDTDCYNRATIMNVHQGYYIDQGTPDSTLYTDSECGDNAGGATDYVNTNRIGAVTPPSVKYIVYESNLQNQSNDQSCDRTHEAPSVSNVRVIPEMPNAGQDLLCNYTYSDPENFTEQNSSYEWWKNSVNQNINSQILNKNNLTPGDSWYCKVTPSDGLLLGTQVQSTNTVTIRNATQNPVLYVSSTSAWNESGYFGSEINIFEFGDELNSSLSSCTADAEGFCNISLKFSSDNVGVLNVSVENSIYYTESKLPDTTPPSFSNLKTSPTSPATYQKNQQYQFNATWQDNTAVNITLIEFNNINYTMSQNGNEYYYTFTDLATGSYNYYFWANDTSGNSNKTDTLTYIINKANSLVYTYLNNSRSNITINAGTSIYLNGTLVTGQGIIQLYNNGTLINSGQSPLSNLTAFNNAGLYNITTVYSETQNYTSSFETWWVNAIQAVAPDQNKFLIKNSSGQITAWLSDSGNIFLNGVLEVYSNYQRTANDEVIMRFNEQDVLIVDNQNGSMYIKGNIAENQNALSVKDNSDEFIIKDTDGNVVLYVNESGYVFMKL